MLSFIGDYSCKADGKGRVVVPASFRKVMQVSQQSVLSYVRIYSKLVSICILIRSGRL
nr:MraZ N-terminal domain-containing protein [Odoribacter sp. OF09-27XD]